MFTARELPKLFWPIALVVFGFLFLASVSIGYMVAPQATNSIAQNKVQANSIADNQMMSSADREIKQRIRQSIHRDKSLSVSAQNIRIIPANGQVTLRGLVRSAQEKVSLEAKAMDVAGDGNVTNNLEVAPSN
jgi:hyperosmotically inducible protein